MTPNNSTSEHEPPVKSVLFWCYAHALVMLLALLFSCWFSRLDILILVTVLSFTSYIGMHFGRAIFGYANAVTFFRLLLLLAVAQFHPLLSDWNVAGLLLCCLVLDGFDGYLARRFGESSEFGQYFDVETDAFAILLLAYLLWLQNLMVWILMVGALRYIYLWLIRLTVHEQRIEPKRLYASVVAVTVYIVMTVRLTFESVVLDFILWLAVAALFLSFLRSALHQWGWWTDH